MSAALTLKRKTRWTYAGIWQIPDDSGPPNCINCLGWEARTTDPHDPDKEVVYSGTLHGGRA